MAQLLILNHDSQHYWLATTYFETFPVLLSHHSSLSSLEKPTYIGLLEILYSLFRPTNP